MARSRTIVGIGEAVRAEYPDRIEPGGLAVLVPLHARRFGHAGVPISRIGQDAPGDELAAMLTEQGLDLSHLQRDPDHPTGRLKVQRIGRTIRRSLDSHAAFDELQWDFDLSDVAPVADAVVCGDLGCRSSQARTVIERFLDEAGSALRIVDLTDSTNLEDIRSRTRGVLDRVDLLLADEPAVRALVPRSPEAAVAQLCRELCRVHQLVSVVVMSREEGAIGLTVVSGDAVATSAQPVRIAEDLTPVVSPVTAVAFAHGLLAGWDENACISLTVHALHFTSEAEPREAALPDEMLRAPSSNGAS